MLKLREGRIGIQEMGPQKERKGRMVWGETTETLKALEFYQESLEVYPKS